MWPAAGLRKVLSKSLYFSGKGCLCVCVVCMSVFLKVGEVLSKPLYGSGKVCVCLCVMCVCVSLLKLERYHLNGFVKVERGVSLCLSAFIKVEEVLSKPLY